MFRTPEKLSALHCALMAVLRICMWEGFHSMKENKDANKYSPSAYYVLEGLENIISFNPHYKNT